MQRSDLEWLTETLPWIVETQSIADEAVASALIKTATEAKFNALKSPAPDAPTVMTRKAFFVHLGHEVADALQALWAFQIITYDEAIMRANELSHHLTINPLNSCEHEQHAP